MWWIESNPRKPTGSCSSLLGDSPARAGSSRHEPRAHYRTTTTAGSPVTFAYGLSDLSSAERGRGRGRNPQNKNSINKNIKDSKQNEEEEEEEEEEEACTGFSSRVRNPTTKLTGAQLSYLLVKQALPSMFITGAVNFAVACPMYAAAGSPPPFLFRPPVSLVADAALTTLVQSAISWACLVVLVNREMSRGGVAPYAPLPSAAEEVSSWWWWGGEPRNAAARWFLMLDHYNAERGSMLLGPCGRLCYCCCCCYCSSSSSSPFVKRAQRAGRWMAFGLAGLGRAVIVALLGFLIMIGPTIGICVAVGKRLDGDWVFPGRWDGALFKLVYGTVLGFITSPALALMWMLRAGWIVNRHRMV
ncbi:hypothetical protein VTH82DRAFT_7385 [Thermothelomyces myriococcoides]